MTKFARCQSHVCIRNVHFQNGTLCQSEMLQNGIVHHCQVELKVISVLYYGQVIQCVIGAFEYVLQQLEVWRTIRYLRGVSSYWYGGFLFSPLKRGLNVFVTFTWENVFFQFSKNKNRKNPGDKSEFFLTGRFLYTGMENLFPENFLPVPLWCVLDARAHRQPHAQ